MMTFRVVHKPSDNHVRCPYRIVEQVTGREIDWNQPVPRLRNLRVWPTLPCEPMRTNCCTFSGGGRVFTTLTRLPKRPSPKLHCWTMCDSSPVKNASDRRHH